MLDTQNTLVSSADDTVEKQPWKLGMQLETINSNIAARTQHRIVPSYFPDVLESWILQVCRFEGLLRFWSLPTKVDHQGGLWNQRPVPSGLSADCQNGLPDQPDRPKSSVVPGWHGGSFHHTGLEYLGTYH